MVVFHMDYILHYILVVFHMVYTLYGYTLYGSALFTSYMATLYTCYACSRLIPLQKLTIMCLLQGMKITLRRPIYNPKLQVPGTDVAIDIPSITAVLAESEYQFITSMAGDNFSEPLKVPQAAQWLQQYYSAEPMVAVPELADEEGEGRGHSPLSP